jgi:hypothetical protein
VAKQQNCACALPSGVANLLYVRQPTLQENEVSEAHFSDFLALLLDKHEKLDSIFTLTNGRNLVARFHSVWFYQCGHAAPYIGH